jgi:hypothetical protein
MSKSVDYILQDAATLIDVVAANHDALVQKGFTQTKEDALNAAYNDAKQKNGAQVKALKLVNEKTGEQDSAFDAFLQLIVRVQSAGKSAFYDNTSLLKRFRVGDRQPGTVKSLATWGEYFTGLILEYEEILLQNGLVQDDLTAFNTAYAQLLAVDASQESAKKLQNAATITRNQAAKKLKDQLIKTRNFVKAAFAGNPELLVQFKPIPKGRTGAAEETGEQAKAAS